MIATALKTLFALLLATGLADSGTVDPQALGRQYTAWFYAGESEKLWERFSPEMKQALPANELAAFRGQIEAELGSETEVVSEQITPVQTYQVYIRTVRMSKAPVPIIVQFALDASGNVAGFYIRPVQEPAPSKQLDGKRGEPSKGQTIRPATKEATPGPRG